MSWISQHHESRQQKLLLRSWLHTLLRLKPVIHGRVSAYNALQCAQQCLTANPSIALGFEFCPSRQRGGPGERAGETVSPFRRRNQLVSPRALPLGDPEEL